MSTFFRDTSLGFKPRSNIFTKLRVKGTSAHNSVNYDTEKDDDGGDSPILNYVFDGDQSVTALSETGTEQIVVDSKEIVKSASTPKIVKELNVRMNSDDDDFEITEVRNLNNGDSNPSKSNIAFKGATIKEGNPISK